MRLSIILSLLLLTGSLAAETPASPEQVAENYFNAVKRDGIVATTGFMSQDALLEFKRIMLEVVELDQHNGGQFTIVIFGMGATYDSVAATTPEQFMMQFMEFLDLQMKSVGVSWDAIEVLGTIDEGARRHVLTRIGVGAGAVQVTEMEVLTLVDDDGEWKMGLTGDIRGIAQQLRAQLAGV